MLFYIKKSRLHTENPQMTIRSYTDRYGRKYGITYRIYYRKKENKRWLILKEFKRKSDAKDFIKNHKIKNPNIYEYRIKKIKK